ncbi:MAG: DUF4416 family protein [Planctomycetia bacterium]|nr:DUF4416 family protein [Planctomycetia bacterium]
MQVPLAALFTGLLAGSEELLSAARDAVEGEWGPIALASPPRPWTESDYYASQMGPGLLRQFLVFDRPARVDSLAAAKLRAIALEVAAAAGAAVPRPVNIDPGHLGPHNLTLASTKQAGHRIWIGHGIWAEITLVFRDGAFQPLPWTYPDFRRPETLEFLSAGRRLALAKVRPETK